MQWPDYWRTLREKAELTEKRKKGHTKQHPGPPGWGFSAELTTLPCKIQLGKKKQMKVPTAAVEALKATREEGDKWAS